LIFFIGRSAENHLKWKVAGKQGRKERKRKIQSGFGPWCQSGRWGAVFGWRLHPRLCGWWELMKTLKQLMEELAQSGASYKITAQDGEVMIAVDGLMHSLRKPTFGLQSM